MGSAHGPPPIDYPEEVVVERNDAYFPRFQRQLLRRAWGDAEPSGAVVARFVHCNRLAGDQSMVVRCSTVREPMDGFGPWLEPRLSLDMLADELAHHLSPADRCKLALTCTFLYGRWKCSPSAVILPPRAPRRSPEYRWRHNMYDEIRNHSQSHLTDPRAPTTQLSDPDSVPMTAGLRRERLRMTWHAPVRASPRGSHACDVFGQYIRS